MSSLKGIKVLELAAVLAGPTVGQFLAELGAEVVKVEPPAGDVTRSWVLPNEQVNEGRSAYFCAANWGKTSLIVDLKNETGRQALQALLQTADILLMSFKPGDGQHFGLNAAQLQMQYPRLIIGEINGYGANDPRVGYDAIIQAEAGFTYLNGHSTNDYHKMPVALVDLLAAHQLKAGILMALYEREKTGKGRHVSVALLDAALSALANQATNYLVGKVLPQPMGSGHPNIVPYGSIFKCANQQGVVLAVGTDRQFERLCGWLKIPVLADWKSNAERVKNRIAVEQALEKAIGQINSETFLEACAELQIPAGRVNQMDTAMHLALERGLILQADGLAGLRQAVFETPSTVLTPPPGILKNNQDL
jgi:crotonobetainyl-CoA:carnitine CoA-transferase CaiB-like acyl-CoA transferase